MNDFASLTIIYFSWTGNTRSVVDVLVQSLKPHVHVRVEEIRPRWNFPYPIWLVLSFIPGAGTRINRFQDLSSPVILAMPKWTVNCPPVTTFLRKGYLREKEVFLVISYGGFDEKRYAASYRKKVARCAARVRDVLLVKRRRIQEGDLDAVREWAARHFLKPDQAAGNSEQ
jgi:hypothetical protein